MDVSNVEIAKVSLCSEGSVRKAVERKRLDAGSLESVVGFVLAMRLKQLGLCGLDDLMNGSSIPAGVQRGCPGVGDPIIDYSESQE